MIDTYSFINVVVGGDVELFLKKDKENISSDNFIKTENIYGTGYHSCGNKGLITKDGYQIEINLHPSTCRAYVCNSIAGIFRALKTNLPPEIQVDYKTVIEIPPKQFKTLSIENKQFGCDPDFNASNNCIKNEITVNPMEYRNRSAGGHLHFGISMFSLGDKSFYKNSFDNNNRIHDLKDGILKNKNNSYYNCIAKALVSPEITIPIMDIIVGNTCVLLDRDINQIERRKVYGKAGAFRYPSHGLEYRTLSNFWLCHPAIASFVFGLGKLAVLISADSFKSDNSIYNNLIKSVDYPMVIDAINNNDYKLAKKTFLNIEKQLVDICGYNETENTPFSTNKMKMFKYLCLKTLKKEFPKTPMYYWTTAQEGHYSGIDSYLSRHFSKVKKYENLEKDFENLDIEME